MRNRLVATLMLSAVSASALATQTTYEYTGILHGMIGFQQGEQSFLPYDTSFTASFTFDQDAAPDSVIGGTSTWLDAVKGGSIMFGDNGEIGSLWSLDRSGVIVATNDLTVDGEPYADQFLVSMPVTPLFGAGGSWWLQFFVQSDPNMFHGNPSLSDPLPLQAMLDAPLFSGTIGVTSADGTQAMDARVMSVSVPEPESMWLMGTAFGVATFARRRLRKRKV